MDWRRGPSLHRHPIPSACSADRQPPCTVAAEQAAIHRGYRNSGGLARIPAPADAPELAVAPKLRSNDRPADVLFWDLTGIFALRDKCHVMKGWILAKVRMRFFSLVLLFTLCQIVGTMCTVPDLSLADDAARLAEEMSHMACPMDGTSMCPLSAVSSPERQSKPPATTDLDQIAIRLSPVEASTVYPPCEFLSWSSASEFVPISIASSSVLRI